MLLTDNIFYYSLFPSKSERGFCQFSLGIIKVQKDSSSTVPQTMQNVVSYKKDHFLSDYTSSKILFVSLSLSDWFYNAQKELKASKITKDVDAFDQLWIHGCKNSRLESK